MSYFIGYKSLHRDGPVRTFRHSLLLTHIKDWVGIGQCKDVRVLVTVIPTDLRDRNGRSKDVVGRILGLIEVVDGKDMETHHVSYKGKGPV